MALPIKKSKTSVSAREAIADVLNTLEEADVDPIKELAELSKATSTPLEIRVKILQDLASYKAPKRKAVDVNINDGDGLTVKIIKVNSPKAAVDTMFKESAKPKDDSGGDNSSS